MTIEIRDLHTDHASRLALLDINNASARETSPMTPEYSSARGSELGVQFGAHAVHNANDRQRNACRRPGHIR
jgi:hypothetical protein